MQNKTFFFIAIVWFSNPLEIILSSADFVPETDAHSTQIQYSHTTLNYFSSGTLRNNTNFFDVIYIPELNVFKNAL